MCKHSWLKAGITCLVVGLAASVLPAQESGGSDGGTSGGTTTVRLGNTIVIGWNSLGMHCMSPRFAEMTVLPPYNDLWAVAIRRGATPTLVTTGANLSYGLNGNTKSSTKTDFWQYAQALFGRPFALDVGLTGDRLSGQMKPVSGHWEATGVPATAYNDKMVWDPYQTATLRLTSGRTTATTTMVVPVSDELNCAKCHAAGGVAAQGITTPTLEGNILTLHDKRLNTNLMATRPVLCARCHSDNALGAPGVTGVPSLSQSMHDKHSTLAAQPACYDCHPGVKTQCNRSAIQGMGPKNGDPQCQMCHGTLANVAATVKNGRIPWVQEPTCAQCHGQAYSTGTTLYRNANGHGGVPCAACHNSPHAWWPSMKAVDNSQPIALMGRAATIGKNNCAVCHTDGRTGRMPPHPNVGGTTGGGTGGTGTGGTGTGGTGTGGTGGTIDGAALYTADCASCHGVLATSSKLGRTAAQITAAIGSVSAMSGLSTLSSAQIQAIATALAGTGGTGTGGTGTGGTGTGGTGTSGTGTGGTGTGGTGTGGTGTGGTIDGAALYTADCAGCHGALATSSKQGRTAAQISAAISSVSGMRSLSTLSSAQIQALATALAGTGGTTGTGGTGGTTGGTGGTTGTTDGAALYTADCSSCHGVLASSSVRGSSAAKITSAIGSVSAMKGFSTLSSAQIQALATALGG